MRYLLLISALAACVPAFGQNPNIVFVLADDLGWNDVGYQNPEVRTPRLDSLATDGVRLTQYRVNSLCSPTRASLFTGQTAIRAGVRRPGEALPPDARLTPETLRAAGYQTWLVGKWHLGHIGEETHPNQRGFDHFYGLLRGFIDSYTHIGEDGQNRDWQRNGTPVDEEGYSTDLLAAEAIRLVENRDPSRPFYLNLSFNAPHTPLAAPEEVLAGWAHVEDPNRRAFLAMVEALDSAFGRLYDVLEAEGVADDTLIVFMSDNGGNARTGGADNSPLRGEKFSAFDGGVRVPAFVHWPNGLEGGREFSLPTTVMDWAPTLAEVTGTAVPSEVVDGVSIWSALSEGTTIERGPIIVGSRNSWAVLEGDWKYIENNDRGSRRLLYRPFEDPGESADLSQTEPDVFNRLAQTLLLHPDGDALEPPSLTSAVNGADFSSAFAAQGWVAVFGENLSATTRIWQRRDLVGGQLPTQLDGVSVSINGVPAYPYFVSPTQLNVLAPGGQSTGPVNIRVTTVAGESEILSAEQALFAPALFRFDPEDRKYAAAVHADGALAAPPALLPGTDSRPLQVGDVVLLFGTGFGPTSPELMDGASIQAPLPLVNPVTVRMGGLDAEVLFAGVVSPGLVQLNVIVPEGVPGGDVEVEVSVAGFSSASGVCLPVAP